MAPEEVAIPDRDSRKHAPRPGETSSLDELEDLYRLSPVGLCAVDRELRYVRANAAFAQIVGCELAQMIGRRMDEVNDGPESTYAMTVGRQVIGTGKAMRDVEIRGPDRDDPERTRVFLMNVRPVEQAGRVAGAVAAVQDVSAVRLAEEEAHERLRELESIYRNAPVALAFIDHDLRYLRVNQRLADLNDSSIEGMIGRTYRDLSPETADDAEPLLRRLMAHGRPVRNLEVQARPPSDRDRTHHFLVNMEPVRGRDDEILGHLSAIQDVTKLRQAEETAARRLEELEALYASAPVGLCSMDLDLRIVHLNPLFARLSERPPGQQVGAPVREVLPEAVAQQLVPELEVVARTGLSSGHVQVRARLRRSGAQEYTWISHVHPVRSGSGEVTGVVAVLQDVTVLIDRQREIEATRNRLAEAQRVARVGSWEWNLLEDRVWWSQEMYEIYGEPPSYQPTYLGVFEHAIEADRPKLRRQWDRMLREDDPVGVTYRILRGDGSERLILGTGRLERTEDGVAARIVGTCQDVTRSIVSPPTRARPPAADRR